MELAPLKAVKRGAGSTPGSARPKSPLPLSREEGELPHDEGGQGTGRKTPDPPAGGGAEAQRARRNGPGPWGYSPFWGC